MLSVWTRRLLLCVLFLCALHGPTQAIRPVDFQVADGLLIEHAGANVWVVLDELPENVTPALIYELYALIAQTIDVPHPDSALRDWVGRVPVVVRYTSDDISPYPIGTERFAGLTGLAAWHCTPLPDHPQELRRCTLYAGDDDTLLPGTDPVILLVVACDAATDCDHHREEIGFMIHELAHTRGAIDGLRCPFHEDHMPYQHLPPDPTDAYWWFGVQGMFELQCDGLVMNAFAHDCTSCDDPALCATLEQILQRSVPDLMLPVGG